MRNYNFNVSRVQALKATDMCLQNALSFVEDAKQHVKCKKLDHLPIPITFALEEIGKAKLILEKLKAMPKHINFITNDGFYNHESKLKIAVDMLDLPIRYKMTLSLVLGAVVSDFMLDPLVIAIVHGKKNALKKKASTTHEMRLSSSFVDFDPSTGEPKLGHNLSERDMNLIINAITELEKKVRTERNQIS